MKGEGSITVSSRDSSKVLLEKWIIVEIVTYQLTIKN